MLKRGNHGEGEVGAWRLGADFRLHPLIHTIPLENSLQDVGGGSERANYELEYVNFKQNSADFRS
jgi:hypothetical protein